MRILSITVRNYRVHQEVTVTLDQSRTVVGGLNESGKSTLIEAAHRALFMRYKTGGDAQAKMMSHHGGHPVVEVDFEVDGTVYRIAKQFRGQSGSAILTGGGPTLNNDAAETRLAELLGLEPAGGKSGAHQWAHLWVRQGTSFDDPTETANAQLDMLIAQFQKSGNVVATQSVLDSQLASRFEARREEVFTKNGTPKKGSELSAATEAHELAAERLALAEEAVTKLLDAADTVHSATQTLKDDVEALNQLTTSQQEVQARMIRVQELRGEVATQLPILDKAVAELTALAHGDARIVQLREAEQAAAAALAPLQERAEAAAAAEEGAKARCAEAAGANEAAATVEEEANQHARLAELYHRLSVIEGQREAIGARLARAEVLQGEMDALTSQMAGVAHVSDADWDDLQKLVQARSVADAILLATAAGIELEQADAPVIVGGSAMAPGTRTILTADTVVLVGDGVRLRITPGGGASLVEAQVAFEDASRMLRARLGDLGVSSIEEAKAALERRRELQREQHGVEVKLTACDAASGSSAHNALQIEAQEVQSDLERRLSQEVSHEAPANAAQAEAALLLHKRKAEEANIAVQQARDEYKASLAALTSCSADRKALAASALENTRLLQDCQLDVKVELGKFGDDADRKRQLDALQSDGDSCRLRVLQTEAEIAELQPDALERDVTRIARSIENLVGRRTATGEALAVAKHVLTQNGTVDPHADLVFATTQEQQAKSRRGRAVRHARSIDLLHTLFSEEQEAAAAQFSAPLKLAIARYLHCLFGPKSNVSLDYDGSALQSLGLTRGAGAVQGTFQFNELSGGAKEQLGAALRLGVAEVLAAGHGGTLPVVFDDAFAFSDPQRLAALQRMLDLAAERGLQVIVLTCNPKDYVEFGASLVMLKGSLASTVALSTPLGESNAIVTPAVAAPAPSDAHAQPVTSPTPPFAASDVAYATSRFVTTLEARGGRAGNGSLREALGLNPDDYESIKQHLLKTNRIVIGAGRGGSVILCKQ